MKKALFALCSIFLVALPAVAQDKQDLALAEKKYEEGEVLFKVQEYAKALEAYKASFLLSKAPLLLYNIAQCQRFLGTYEEAITSYKSFLREVPEAPNRKTVEGFINGMEESLASGVTKEGQEKAAKLSIQAESFYQVQEYGKALATYKESYLLSKQPEILYSLGECQRQLKQYEEAIKSYKTFLQARPDSPQRDQAETLIKESEARLEEERAAREAARVATQPTSQSSTQTKDKKPSKHLFFYGGAGAFGAGGLILGALSLSAARDAKSQSEITLQDPPIDFDEIERLSGRSKNLAHLSDAFLVAGLASGVAGFIVSRKTNADVAVVLSLSGVSALVTF